MKFSSICCVECLLQNDDNPSEIFWKRFADLLHGAHPHIWQKDHWASEEYPKCHALEEDKASGGGAPQSLRSGQSHIQLAAREHKVSVCIPALLHGPNFSESNPRSQR